MTIKKLAEDLHDNWCGDWAAEVSCKDSDCEHWKDIKKALSDVRNLALEEAASIVKTWHIRKGGFTELEYQILDLKEKS